MISQTFPHNIFLGNYNMMEKIERLHFFINKFGNIKAIILFSVLRL